MKKVIKYFFTVLLFFMCIMAIECKCENLDWIKFEDEIKNIEIVPRSCTEIALFYVLKHCDIKDVKYLDIVKEFKEKIGIPPFSLLEITIYLERKNIKSKALRLNSLSELHGLKYDLYIFYFEKTINDKKIGHFSFVKKTKNKKIVLLDPLIDSSMPVIVTEDFLKSKNWSKIVLLIEN